MIRFTRVGKRFGATAALEDIDWEVEAGERVAVLGHSGAGKTTLLRLLAMELAPSTGSVEVGSFRSGQLNASSRNLLRRTLGIVFEDIRLLPDRSIRENLALVLQIKGIWDPKQIDKKVVEALEVVGAGECMRLLPNQLSGGERQRVAVARALIREPLLLIADEPTGNLDPPAAEKVLGAIMAANDRGTTVVLSTNDKAQCDRFGGRLLRLAQGRIPSS